MLSGIIYFFEVEKLLNVIKSFLRNIPWSINLKYPYPKNTIKDAPLTPNRSSHIDVTEYPTTTSWWLLKSNETLPCKLPSVRPTAHNALHLNIPVLLNKFIIQVLQTECTVLKLVDFSLHM